MLEFCEVQVLSVCLGWCMRKRNKLAGRNVVFDSSVTEKYWGRCGRRECEGASTQQTKKKKWREDETAGSVRDSIAMVTEFHAQRTANSSQDIRK